MTLDELRALCIDHAIAVGISGTVRPVDAARLLGISPRTLRRWRADELPPLPVRVGRSWRYSLADLADAMSAFVRSRDADPLPAITRREHDRARPEQPCSIHRRRSA